MRPSFAPLLVAALLLTPLTAKADEIVLGAPLSMTGTYGYIGPDVQKGMLLAIGDINASGGAGAGRTLKLLVDDDGSDRNQSITLARRMALQDHALAIVGPNSTVTALAVAPVANDLKIPMLGIAVSSAVTQAGPWSFHVMAPPNLLMTGLAKYTMDKLRPKTVLTVAGRDNEGAVAQIKAARAYFEGKTTLLPEESALMSETNFSALANKIASLNPDVVMIAMADANAASLIVQCREAGVADSTRFVGNNAQASPSFIKIGGAAVEGACMAADAFPQARTDATATTFMAAYQARYQAAPSQWAAMGYTMIRIMAQAIADTASPPTRDEVRAALAKVHGVQSLLGRDSFSFDAAREPNYEPLVLTVKHGAFQLTP